MNNRRNLATLLIVLVSLALWAGAIYAQASPRARIIHVAPDLPMLDVYLNGELAAADLSYGDDSAFFSLPAGDAELLATVAGAATQLILQPVNIGGDASAIVLTSDASERARIVPDDLSPLEFGLTRLSIVNALDDAIDIESATSADERLTDGSIAPGASLGALDLPAGQVELSLTSASADGDAARHDLSAILAAGASNMLLIHGDAGEPQLLQATAAADADDHSGRVRFIHAVPGAAPIDLKINDLMIIPSLAFARPTEHIALFSGSHQLTLSLGGTVISSTSLDVYAGQMQTVAVIGSPASLKPVSFNDSLRDLTETSALVNLINAVPNSAVRRLRLESGAIVAADVQFGDKGGSAQIVPGKQTMSMMLDIGDLSGTVDVPASNFYPGSYYNLIALPGSAFTAPRLLIAETSLMRRISATAPLMQEAATDETEPPVADSATEAEAPGAMMQTDDAPLSEEASDADSKLEQEATDAIETSPETAAAGEADPDIDAGPSLVMGPYAIVDLEPSARLQLRQFPSSHALSLGLLPGRSELIVLGRRGLTVNQAGEAAELPIDLSDYTTDPAAALYPAQDLQPADTWLFVMYQTEDRGALVGWANAYYLQVFDEKGESQRLASLPMVRQNRAGSTTNTDVQPPVLSDHVSVRVHGLNPNALLNLRMANSPESEVMTQLAPNTELVLIGLDAADKWAFVDYAAENGEIMRGWVSASYIQLLLNGDPVLVSTLRALDETVAPHVSAQLRGSIRSAEASGPTPIPLSDDMMAGVVGEVALDPGAMLHLRRGPSISAESLAMVPAGAHVMISGITENKEWLKTSYADREGWIFGHYVALRLRGRLYHRDYVESLLPAHDNSGNPLG